MPIGSSPHGIGDVEVINKINRTIDQTVNQTTERIDFRIIEPIKATTSVNYIASGPPPEWPQFLDDSSGASIYPEMGYPMNDSDELIEDIIAAQAGRTAWIQPPTGTATPSFWPEDPGIYRAELDCLATVPMTDVENMGQLTIEMGDSGVPESFPAGASTVTVPADDGTGATSVPAACTASLTFEVSDTAWSGVKFDIRWSDDQAVVPSLNKTSASIEMIASLVGEE